MILLLISPPIIFLLALSLLKYVLNVNKKQLHMIEQDPITKIFNIIGLVFIFTSIAIELDTVLIIIYFISCIIYFILNFRLIKKYNCDKSVLLFSIGEIILFMIYILVIYSVF